MDLKLVETRLLVTSKKKLLGCLDDLIEVIWRIVTERGDAYGGTDEVAQHGGAFDDVCVMSPVGQCIGVVAELDDVVFATNGIEVSRVLRRSARES